MTYATRQDMIERHGEQALIELTDRVEPILNIIIDTVLNAALADASALIDSFVGRRHAVPLATIPPALVRHACAIAFYDLHRGRHSEETRKAFEDAMDYLRNISTGTVVLNIAGNEPASAPAQAVSAAPGRTFNRDTLKGF